MTDLGLQVTEVFRSHKGTCDADSDAGPGKGGCENPDTDFLSVGGCMAATREWYHHHDANPQFLQWVAPVHRQMSLNVMARFTHKMMTALVRAHLAGRHAFLEMEVCSVANMAGLTTGSMNWIARGDQHSVMKPTEELLLPTGLTLVDVGVFDGKLAGKIVPMVNRAPPGWMVATAASGSGSEAYERECAELRERMDDCCNNGSSSGSSEEAGCGWTRGQNIPPFFVARCETVCRMILHLVPRFSIGGPVADAAEHGCPSTQSSRS